MTTENSRVSSMLFMGGVTILVGVLFLLDNFGLLHGRHWFSFWPAVLIVAGLAKLLFSDRGLGRVGGFVLLAFGVLLELDTLGILYVNFDRLWPLGLIAVGLFLMWHAIEARKSGGGGMPWMSRASVSSQLNVLSVFGGGEHVIQSKNFKGGQAMAMFGGFEIDLTGADIEGPEAVIDASVVFGGGVIRIPQTWNVVIQGLGMFGGYGNKTRTVLPSEARAEAKTLVVKGVAVFGGVEIKN